MRETTDSADLTDGETDQEARHVVHLPDHGPLDQGPLTAIIGVLFAVTVLGFAASRADAR